LTSSSCRVCRAPDERCRARRDQPADDIIRTAATSAGFKFADVRSIFVGHQLCSYGEKWLHALNYLSIGVSYHLTAAGQSGGYYPVFRSAVG
jgi:hypothetical protein